MSSRYKRNLKERVWLRDSLKCRYCGKKLEMPPRGISCHDNVYATVDHIMPKALGGKTKLSNLLTACLDCNAAKADRHPLAFSISVIIA